MRNAFHQPSPVYRAYRLDSDARIESSTVLQADNDADAFVAPYAPDATAVHTGTVMPDRDAIRATMVAGFAGPLQGSEGIHEVQSVRFVGADTAIVLSRVAYVKRFARDSRVGFGL